MKKTKRKLTVAIKAERRIVQSGVEPHDEHREDFRTCPHCDYAIESDEWDKLAITLVLNPRCFKAGYVSIISEYPKCFRPSWVHHRMSGFSWGDTWPRDWQEAVRTREACVKLLALREFGASLCHSCKFLVSGTVEYHAWVHCVFPGSGSMSCAAQKVCDKYEKL